MEDKKERLRKYKKEYNLRYRLKLENKIRKREITKRPESIATAKRYVSNHREKIREYNKEYGKGYRQKGEIKIKNKEYLKKYNKDNELVLKQKRKEYIKRPEVNLRMKKYNQDYWKNNKEELAKSQREYYKNLPYFTITCKDCGETIITKTKATKYCRACTLEKAYRNGKNKNTRPEEKIKTFIDRLNIYYDNTNPKTRKYFPNALLYFMDIYLPTYKICIECDGDYFHCNPYIKKKDGNYKYPPDYYNKLIRKTAEQIWEYDKNKTKYLEALGITVLRLWESEIGKMTLHDFEDKLLSLTNNDSN